jgi:sarcosine oxidase delta subunit
VLSHKHCFSAKILILRSGLFQRTEKEEEEEVFLEHKKSSAPTAFLLEINKYRPERAAASVFAARSLECSPVFIHRRWGKSARLVQERWRKRKGCNRFLVRERSNALRLQLISRAKLLMQRACDDNKGE